MESKWAESSWAHRVQLENDMAHAHTHTHKLNYPMFVPYFESGPASTASHIPCLCHAISLCLCIFSSTSCSMVAIWHQIEVAGQKRQRSTEKKCGLCDRCWSFMCLRATPTSPYSHTQSTMFGGMEVEMMLLAIDTQLFSLRSLSTCIESVKFRVLCAPRCHSL